MSGVTRRAVVLSLAATSLLTIAGKPAHALATEGGLLLVDASLATADLLAHVSSDQLASARQLDADLVQAWRAGLREACTGLGHPVAAYVRWDKAFVLAALGREEGMTVASARLSQSLFRVQLVV
jgi:Na+(H+)/acetate symporter ActP